MPRYIIGAVSMKMRSSTSTTSTSGMMLISASEVPMRRPSPPPSTLNAIFAGQLPHRARDEIEEIVVPDDRGNGGGEAGRGRDQRFGDTGRDDGEVRRALLPDTVERRH